MRSQSAVPVCGVPLNVRRSRDDGAAARMSAMLFMILAGAAVFSHALTKLLIPQQIVSLVSTMELGTFGFLLMMMALIFVLGMFLESIAIILITSPVVLPVLALLEISPIWYGVMLVINLEP